MLTRAGYPFHFRDPKKTVLWQTLNSGLDSFIERSETRGQFLPGVVKSEVNAFLECGILENGFSKLGCTTCGHVRALAFSCKRRGICPSCGGRRMNQTAANLVDQTIPDIPIRQWVISFPHKIRFWIANTPADTSRVLKIITRVINRFYQEKYKTRGRKNGTKVGSICFIQRFGGSVNLNPHFHIIYADGVWQEENTQLKFTSRKKVTNQDIENVCIRIFQRVERAYEKAMRDMEHSFGREYLGESIGGKNAKKIGKLFNPPWAPPAGNLVSYVNGYSLHAGVRIGKNKKEDLEQLLRYVARPAVSNKRLKLTEHGKIQLELKNKFFDGTTHLEFTQDEFIKRLISLIPPARSNLVRYFGVFAPRFKRRNEVVRTPIPPKASESNKAEKENGNGKRSYWIPYVELMKRSFKVDVSECLKCGGEIELLSMVLDPVEIKAVLKSLGLSGKEEAAFFHEDRGPPTEEIAGNFDYDFDQSCW